VSVSTRTNSEQISVLILHIQRKWQCLSLDNDISSGTTALTQLLTCQQSFSLVCGRHLHSCLRSLKRCTMLSFWLTATLIDVMFQRFQRAKIPSVNRCQPPSLRVIHIDHPSDNFDLDDVVKFGEQFGPVISAVRVHDSEVLNENSFHTVST